MRPACSPAGRLHHPPRGTVFTRHRRGAVSLGAFL